MVAVRKDSLGRFPFGRSDLELRMRHEEMPHNALKRFAVRRDVRGIHRRHNDTGGCLLRSVTTVATDNADDRRAD